MLEQHFVIRNTCASLIYVNYTHSGESEYWGGRGIRYTSLARLAPGQITRGFFTHDTYAAPSLYYCASYSLNCPDYYSAATGAQAMNRNFR